MPWDRKLYPKDWDTIAYWIKRKANWTCQDCGRPCRRPGETVGDLDARLREDGHEEWLSVLRTAETGFEVMGVDKPGQFVLTVAHLNHRPEDCRPENLRALCAPCHCRMDLKAMATKRRLKAERLGQLQLPLA